MKTSTRAFFLLVSFVMATGDVARADLSASEPAIMIDSPLVRTGIGAGSQTRGYTFSLDAARTLTHLGLYSYNNTDGGNQARQVGLWDADDNLVAEVSVPPSGSEIEVDENGRKFLYIELDTPVVLAAEEIFTVGVWYVDNSPGLAFAVEFSTIDGFNYLQTAETGPPGGAFAKPTILREDLLNGYVGPNLRFDLTPPATNFAEQLRITAVSVSGDGKSVTLTWVSKPTKRYAVRYSLDLTEFSGDFADDVMGDAGATTTKTYLLSDAGLDTEPRWFVRVEEAPP